MTTFIECVSGSVSVCADSWVEGVVVQGVTLTHAVSHYPGEKWFLRQQHEAVHTFPQHSWTPSTAAFCICLPTAAPISSGRFNRRNTTWEYFYYWLVRFPIFTAALLLLYLLSL